MTILDTNILIRYLLNDNEELSNKATEIIEKNNVFITNEVIIEVAYVLQKLYQIDKKVIFSLICELISFDNIHFENKNLVLTTFDTFRKYSMDIVDCMLYAYHKCNDYDVLTFDKKLEKLLNT